VAVVYYRDVLGLKEIDYVNRTVKFEPPKDVALDSISTDIPVEGSGFIRASWRKVDGRITENLNLPSGWRRR
jgi:hypothetical protein